MKLLIVAATKKELEPLSKTYKLVWKKNTNFCSILRYNHTIDFFITGVGMVATTYNLTSLLTSKKYDLIINAGICGSFKRNIKIGEIVQIGSDTFSELGAEDGGNFMPINKMGLLSKKDIFFTNRHGSLKVPYKLVSAITVNKVHGNEISIKKTIKQFNPNVESMEGAAFFYVCKQKKVNCIQLRSVSNYVEKRNTNAWNIPLAIKNLNIALDNLLSSLSAKQSIL